MEEIMLAGLAKWHRFVQEKNLQVLAEVLADNVRFSSPVLWKPKDGHTAAILYLGGVMHVMEDFAYHRQFTDEKSVALEFSARVGKFLLKGVDLIRFNEEGLIDDLEVLVRPAKGLQALGEAMAQQLALATPPPTNSN